MITMNKFKISLVTVTWNSARTIEDTLRSVVGQTYGNIEHIVVDGGSSDATMDIIRKYAAQYRSRGLELKWISERDNGIYDAMNKGISLTSGDVVGILNSDDFFTSPTVVERVSDEFKSISQTEELDAVYGDIHYVNPDRLNKCVRYYSSKAFSRAKMRMGFMPAHPSFYCRRELYQKFGMFDTSFRIAADFELLLRFIYLHRIHTKYLPMDFVTMRTGGTSTSGIAVHRKIYSEHMRAYKKNQIYSNFFMEATRYLYKVIEICRSNLS